LFRKAQKFPPTTLNDTTYQKTETFTDTAITEHKSYFKKKSSGGGGGVSSSSCSQFSSTQ
jgi:hypothetical protein